MRRQLSECHDQRSQHEVKQTQIQLRIENLGNTVRPEERDRLLNQTIQMQININTLQQSLQQSREGTQQAVGQFQRQYAGHPQMRPGNR